MDQTRLDAIRARYPGADEIKLPFDVKIGRTTVRKGCGIGTLLIAIENHNDGDEWKDNRLRDLMKENEKVKDECTDWLDDNARMSSEIERLTADRDAWRRRAECAGRDFVAYMTRNIKGTKGPYACDLCRHGNPDNPGTTCLKGCDGLNKWEWRGPEEDKQ